MLRGENTSKILKLRCIVTQAFRDHYFKNGYFEVTPPFQLLLKKAAILLLYHQLIYR